MTEARAKAIFDEEASIFLEAFPDALRPRFKVRERHFLASPSDRDLAWYVIETHTVCILRRALNHSQSAVRGIIRHELGHAVDPHPTRAGAEARADRFARQATGSPVRYTADGVQNASRGTPRRPRWLSR